MTTTGRPCYWRSAAPDRDPGFVSKKQYSSKRIVTRRNTFDYRATEFKIQYPMPMEKLKQFRDLLREKAPSSLFMFTIGGLFDDLNDSDDEEEEVSDDLEFAANNACFLMWKLNRAAKGHAGPFQIPNTKGQARNPSWFWERAHRGTASDCKTFLGLTSNSAKMRYMRRKIWGLDYYESEAMKHGKLYEPIGRKKYEQYLQGGDPSIVIEETGSWSNSKCPQLSCSPDGLIMSLNVPEVILWEGKYWDKPHVNPKEFHNQLTVEGLKRFYLYMDDNEIPHLKQSHSYYYQIQMSLDILELKWCHLMVYNEAGYIIVPVKYNPEFWHEKRLRMIQRHRELLLPEFALKRTKRYLRPIELVYSHSHEDPNDDFFLEYC